MKPIVCATIKPGSRKATPAEVERLKEEDRYSIALGSWFMTPLEIMPEPLKAWTKREMRKGMNFPSGSGNLTQELVNVLEEVGIGTDFPGVTNWEEVEREVLRRERTGFYATIWTT